MTGCPLLLKTLTDTELVPDYIAIKYLGVTAPKPPATTVQTSQPAQTLADTFKHSIKHDPSLFMVFMDGKQFDSWQCSMMALAHAQDVSVVLDPKQCSNYPR